jgi:hypothetical protein
MNLSPVANRRNPPQGTTPLRSAAPLAIDQQMPEPMTMPDA